MYNSPDLRAVLCVRLYCPIRTRRVFPLPAQYPVHRLSSRDLSMPIMLIKCLATDLGCWVRHIDLAENGVPIVCQHNTCMQ